MTRIFTFSWKGLLTLVLKLHDLFWAIYDTYVVGNQETTIKNKVRAIEHIFVIDAAN